MRRKECSASVDVGQVLDCRESDCKAIYWGSSASELVEEDLPRITNRGQSENRREREERE